MDWTMSNIWLMIALYFREIAFENLEWAEALVWVASPQIDNALRFWFPADDPDGDPPAVFEPTVNFAHSLRPFSFIAKNAPTRSRAGW